MLTVFLQCTDIIDCYLLTVYAEMILYRPPVYTYKVLTCIQSVQERQIYEWKLSINY